MTPMKVATPAGGGDVSPAAAQHSTSLATKSGAGAVVVETPKRDELPVEAISDVMTSNAPNLLTKAAQHISSRAQQYDKPEGERSMGKAVSAFNTITGCDITEAEGWLLLQILKDVRLWQRPGYHADSAEDCIAYAALKAEAKQAEAA